MRVLAVLSPSLDKQIEKTDKYYLEIDDLKIPLALLHVADTKFDTKYSNAVLVRKTGFSLNYRDLGIIERAWGNLKDVEQATFYPIGSDFCGYVEEIGKDVTTLKKGDFVISDCFYPEAKNGCPPGIPTNHGSKELEMVLALKLKKLPNDFPNEQAAGMTIGTQTSISMIHKANVKPNSNVLITSVTSNTSLFLLNFLRSTDCNIYGLSYSGKNVSKVKKEYPFLKEIYSIKDNNIPQDLQFNSVLDPFSDTYLPYLIGSHKLDLGCNYITCGIYNQSLKKVINAPEFKLPQLFSEIIAKNINFAGNCLGSTESLEAGINHLLTIKDSKIIIDSVYTEDNYIGDFLKKAFNYNEDRFGKVSFVY